MSSRGKRKQLKKDNTQLVPNNTLSPDYVSFESPFKNIPSDILKNVLREAGEKHNDVFYRSLDELKSYLNHFDVIDLTTWYTYYTLSGIIPANFEKRKENEILQYHVELLQALLLQNTYPDGNEIMPIVPPNLYEVERLLLNLTESYQFRKLKDFVEYEDETEKKKMFYVDRMRNNTLAVRNWAYPEQIIRITKDVFLKMDEDIKNEIGISVVALIDMFKRIVIKIEDKHNIHMQKAREFYKCNDKDL